MDCRTTEAPKLALRRSKVPWTAIERRQAGFAKRVQLPGPRRVDFCTQRTTRCRGCPHQISPAAGCGVAAAMDATTGFDSDDEIPLRRQLARRLDPRRYLRQ